MTTPRRALLSTWDKRGIEDFARGLVELGFEVLSTGGTASRLAEAGIPVTLVSDATGSDEILDGRVKTLHPVVHAGILARRDDSAHIEELKRRQIPPIDVVAVNLYPFIDTVAAGGSRAECIEMIDIGGPTMLRAAAKNHGGVWVVVDPDDYSQVLESLVEGGSDQGLQKRGQLAAKAFRHSATYESQIANWMEPDSEAPSALPLRIEPTLERQLEPRYGENPHQRAAVYSWSGQQLLGGFEQLQGKQLSYNNLLDLDAARELAGRLDRPAVVIVKHNNPCGVGVGTDLIEAYQRALACDPVSAFGSVIAVNREVGADLAEAMRDLFVEVVVAPAVDENAKEVYSRKTNLRLVEAPAPNPGGIAFRSIDGGLLAQERDDIADDVDDWTVVTRRVPTEDEMAALRLAWTVSRSVRSNAIVIANPHQTVGIGAGQMSRVDACRIAIDKAVLNLDSTAAASDAFFPFADGVETLAAAGISAVVQPGGSRRDDEVIAAADGLGIAMLTTGRRHFRH